MKSLNKIWGIGLLALLLIAAAPRVSMAQDDYISDQDFYDNLEPYGTWVSDPQYGDVWVPDADEGFRPYATRGHWVLTEYGNTWVSDYPWGWATFHYGRWRYDDYYGWEWIPGNEWAPAWVSWRHGGGYYGWAPLTPGISIDISLGNSYNVPDTYWAFAPEAYINRPNIYNYYVPHTKVVTIIHQTTIINNTYVRDNRRYIAGPRMQDIQRVTRQRPQIYKISNARKPGTINIQNTTINIYKPNVKKVVNARPARVVDGAAYRKQNPNQGIAHKGPGGSAAYNHANAVKLAAVARNTNTNNTVVRINNRPAIARPADNRQGNKPATARPADNHQGNKPATAQPARRPVLPENKANTARPGNGPGQPGNKPNPPQSNNHRGQPENRPNVAAPRNNDNNEQQKQQAQQQHDQQQRSQQAQQEQVKQREQQQAQQRSQQAQQEQQKQREQQQAQQRSQQAQQEQQKQREQQQAQQRSQQAQQEQQKQREQQQVQQRAQQAQQRQQQQQQQAQQRQQQQTQRQQQQQQPQREQQPQQHPRGAEHRQ